MNRQGLTQGQSVDWCSERIRQAVLISPHVFLVGQESIETRLLHNGRLIDRTPGEDIVVTHEGAPAAGERPTLHIAMKDGERTRQFELSEESYSVYEWSALSSR